jgi:Carboxypeptidase regulatory-like domain/TonB dependent receptor/TonB-dependent Receptor Plug Domain
MTIRRHLWIAALLVLVAASGAFAQGAQTGVLSGTVLSQDKLPLPGVTVTVKSPALLGVRTAVTDTNGGYIFKGLPSGDYKVTFELSGFGTREKSASVTVGGTVPMDVSLSVASMQETVVVTGEPPTALATTQVGADLKKETIDSLATSRTLFGITTLAPGLTSNSAPNAGQVNIAGSFAFDNVFLVDGVDVNDNLFGTANNLFIEDAIEETQILTSGISAEYGRFSGGVINAVTKRGGNQFTGSFRVNFTNPSWRDETPIETTQGITRQDTTNKFYEATLGGPLIKDRLWFFAAGRKENSNAQTTLDETALPFNALTDQKRGEIKLSGAINPNHNITLAYTKIDETDFRETFDFSIEPVHTAFTGQQPNTLLVANYNGVLRSNLFVEAQYSRKKFGFVGEGGTSTNIIDSPYIAQSVLAHYNAPYFDATDPENRDNRQVSGALSYFLSTKSLGKHDIKIGFENFVSTRTGGNSQSSTNYVFYTDYLTDDAGKPVLDANDFVIPVFTPGVSILQNWIAQRGAQIDLTTNSAYLNDKWTLNNHWSFNLGARAEWAKGEASTGQQPVSSSRIVPRLGASFDVRGDGKYRLDGTYSQYSGKYSETQFANNTNVGNPDAIYYLYTGPAGQGRAFAPGISPANYTQVLTGAFPTANVFYSPDIKSPVTKEWTAQAGMQVGASGLLKAVYTHRSVGDFVQQFVTTGTGTTHVVKNGVDFGTFSNRLWNNTNDGQRVYDAVQLQASFHPAARWMVQGNYTLQLKNDGNQEGEAPNQPGAPSAFSGFYPELFDQARNFPIGPLAEFQRHRARAWTTYDLGLGRAGSLNLGLLYRFDSGSAYSLKSTGQALTAVQKAIGAANYPDLPQSQTIYYADGRGGQFFEDAHLFDVAVTYAVPIAKRLRPWVKAECRNVFDATPLISYNITTRPDPSSPKDALGIPTGFIKGSSFGKATSTANYPFPREFFISTGIRF